MTRISRIDFCIYALLTGIVVTLAVSCSEPEPTAAGSADSLLLRAIRRTNELKFEEARADLELVIKRARKRSDHRNEILGIINFGVLYLKFNATEEALNHFLKASELAEEYKQYDLLNTIYNNTGIVYAMNNAHEKAIDYYEKALAISRQQQNKHRTAMNLLNLGIEARKTGNPAKALECLRQSKAIFTTNRDTVNTAAALFETAEIHYHMQLYDSALIGYKRAYRVGLSARDQYFHPQFSFGLGRAYFKSRVYDSARYFLDKGLSGFTKTKSTEDIIISYEWLTRLSQALGNTSEALKYSNLGLAWKDSLLQEKTTRWISEQQMKYEFSKKENEVELMKAEVRQQQLLWASLAVIAVLVAVFVFFILRSKNMSLAQRNIILQQQQEVNALTLEKAESLRKQLEKDIETQERLNEAERQQLMQEIMYKDRELAAKALHLVNKNELFSVIHTALSDLDLRDPAAGKAQVDKIKKVVHSQENLDQEWETFKLHFEEVHPGFFTYLQQTCPTLSPNDLRLSAYLMIDLNSKEIANIYHISPESVRKKKQRLREKLNMEKDEDLRTLLNRFKRTL